jgi:tRNA-specific 2-thiouridylase
MKAIVAMSGGIDSSVAAFFLKQMGVEVTGLTFMLWDQRGQQQQNVCCSLESSLDARRVCDALGIEHIALDIRQDFADQVIQRFCDSYAAGLTPNPCIFCNQYIKFDALLKLAGELDADTIATGHYARVVCRNGRHLLMRAVDSRKDQSYVLYVMSEQALRKAVFPVGSYRKEEIRRIAAELGLFNAHKPESQDICFVGAGYYADFIAELYPQTALPGPVVDEHGSVVGEHKGIAYYTVGQRKGLAIASKDPLYVLAMDVKSNTIVVGLRERAFQKEIWVQELNWTSGPPPDTVFKAEVKIRSTMEPVPSVVFVDSDSGTVRIVFDEPQWAPAFGQSAVFYINDVVIGGGKIADR